MIHQRAADGSCMKCVLKHARAAKAGLEIMHGLGIEFLRGPASARGATAVRATILVREALSGYRENYPLVVETVALMESMAFPTKITSQLREYRTLLEICLESQESPKKFSIIPLLATLCDAIDACVEEDKSEGMELIYAVDANLAEAVRESPTDTDEGLKASLADLSFRLGSYAASTSMTVSDFYVEVLAQISYIISSIESAFELTAHPGSVEIIELGNQETESSSESSENPDPEKTVPGTVEPPSKDPGQE